MRARIVSLHGRDALADCDGVRYRCSVRGRLKQGRRRMRSPVAVGDWVEIVPEAAAPHTESHTGEDAAASIELVHLPAASIESVEERRNVLSRSSVHNTRLEQVVAVNVDRMLIVLPANDLDIHLPLLDRLLISARMSMLDPLPVANKIDLCGRETALRILAPYSAAGFPPLCVSARDGTGLEDLRAHLRGATSVFCGPSGAGKSSLLNALQPGLALRTAEVREQTGAGRHTTTHVSLLALDGGGYVVDTPGVREFGLWSFEAQELGLWYPEFDSYRPRCRYGGCSHTHEPGCAVKHAVESGAIDQGRYARYVQFLDELRQSQASRP